MLEFNQWYRSVVGETHTNATPIDGSSAEALAEVRREMERMEKRGT